MLLRDYLIQHSGLAEEYAVLKTELARRHSTARGAYQDDKAPFIEQVLEMARLRV
ncbi:MAG: GrpB family protein [Chloroflexi bacterium]|nr:GrpB family protein [Chloroflexota bacterium]